MRRFGFQRDEWKRYGLALVAGLVLAAAYPKIGMAGLAWVAPGLMLMAGMGRSGGAAFRIGYIGGLAFYLAALYWLLLIPVSLVPIVGWLSLAAYLALYPGLWVWLCWKLYPAQTQRQSAPNPTSPAAVSQKETSTPALPDRFPPGDRIPSDGSLAGFLALLEWFLSTAWLKRLGWACLCAVLWVGLEVIVGRLFTGFPWIFLGVSQYRILQVIQLAAVTGVYGVSFLVVWFSVSLAGAVVMLIRRPQVRWHAQRELLAPFLVTAAVVAGGWREITQPDVPHPTVKMALIQPSIPQTWIWDPKESSNRFQQLLQLSEKALTNHPAVLVWPEAAVPYMLRFDEDIYSAVTNLVQMHNVWLVLGSDDGEVRVRPNGRIQTNYFNSSFLISPEGEIMANYRKRRLVIFGEYIPFGRRFSFLEDLTGLGSFTPGERAVSFSMPALRAKAAMLICFEDVFPHLTRASVEEDTDFLLNLTNNGWFDESAAQWQHGAAAVFRAVENGLPLVRCANNGLTCWVDRRGQMHDVGFARHDDIYGIGYKLVEIPLLGGQKHTLTFYQRHGDWFGWGCVALSAAFILGQWLQRRRRR